MPSNLSAREQKLLRAAKYALGFIKANKLYGTFTEQQLRSAIMQYGIEHLFEVDGDILAQDLKLANAGVTKANDGVTQIWDTIEELSKGTRA